MRRLLQLLGRYAGRAADRFLEALGSRHDEWSD